MKAVREHALAVYIPLKCSGAMRTIVLKWKTRYQKPYMFSFLTLSWTEMTLLHIVHQLSAWCVQKRPVWVRRVPDQHHLNTTRGRVVHLTDFV